MKKLMILLATASMGLATPALASNPNDDGPLPGCSPSGQTPQKCDTNNGGDGGDGGAGGNGGAGGAGGTGVGVGIGVGVANSDARANATALSASNATAGALANAEQTQVQGQQQGQVAIANGGDARATGGTANAIGINSNDNRSSATGGTGGSAVASGGAGGNSGGNTFSNTTNYKRAYRTAPMAYAPTVVAGECQKSSTFGLSTPFGGFSHGKTKGYKFCELVKLRTVANDMQLSGEFQCAILSQDKRWARAMKATGESCAAKIILPPVVTPEVITPESPEYGGERG